MEPVTPPAIRHDAAILIASYQPTPQPIPKGGGDLQAVNTLDDPHRVGTETQALPLATTLTLPPASLTVVEMDI